MYVWKGHRRGQLTLPFIAFKLFFSYSLCMMQFSIIENPGSET